MTTNPRWTPNVPPDDWKMFAPAKDAQFILAQCAGILTDATLTIDPEVTPIYTPPIDNPDNVQPWSLSGKTPNGNQVLELAGDLFDRMTNPQDGVDQYPLVEPVELYYKQSEAGLAWRHKVVTEETAAPGETAAPVSPGIAQGHR